MITTLAAALTLALVPAVPVPRDRSASAKAAWPDWQAYSKAFITADGRVVDRDAADRTTSEGQVYAMFFALVADDRGSFERLLRWTDDNLAAGALGARLPAWHWGRTHDGWRVVDDNSASDADLWLAYVLLEASALWGEPRFEALGRDVLAELRRRAVVDVAGLGPVLLPGERGFVLGDGHVRLNPSYVPVQLLRAVARHDATGPWAALADTTVSMIEAASPERFAPDWVEWRAARGFVTDAETNGAGSYDAIRNYLWAATLAPDEPLRDRLLRTLSGPFERWRKDHVVPERVDVRAPAGATKAGPIGFLGAIYPWAHTVGDARAAAALARALDGARRGGLHGARPRYYDQNLILFGRGFVEGRYHFERDGRLGTRWGTRCLGARR
ncbi:cellulase [Myxococcota bacterium]|nr:cellulase [Myxococcota bacterium]